MFQHQQQWGLETSFRILLYVGSVNAMAVTVPGVRFCVCRKRVPLYEADLNALWVLQSQTDLSIFLFCPWSRLAPAHLPQGSLHKWRLRAGVAHAGYNMSHLLYPFSLLIGQLSLPFWHSHVFLYPQNLCKKIGLLFHSRSVIYQSPDFCFHNYTQK